MTIKILQAKQNEIFKLNLDYLARIYWLIEDCKKYGNYPFAGVAIGVGRTGSTQASDEGGGATAMMSPPASYITNTNTQGSTGTQDDPEV